MATVIEDANRRVNDATESLKRAEEELREWKAANQPLDTTHPTFVVLSAEVTRCTAREERAQETLQQALAAQNTVQYPQGIGRLIRRRDSCFGTTTFISDAQVH